MLCFTNVYSLTKNNAGEVFRFLSYLDTEIFNDCESFVRCCETDTASRLAATLRPYMLRRFKSTVFTDMPCMLDISVMVPMSEGQMKLHANILAKDSDTLARIRRGARKPTCYSFMLRRQAACHPYLVAGIVLCT